MKHTDISRDYEHDARHFRFVRNTGLPRSTFDEPRHVSAADWVIVAFAAMIIVALLLEVPMAVFTEWIK